jgi:CHAD domain-containing protein
MADRLRRSDSGSRGIRRLVRQEIARARKALGEIDSLGDESVHDARKSLKKVRAGLRLLRKALGTRLYRRENASFRNAAKPLTEVRDAKVMLETLDQLAEHFKEEANPEALEQIRQALQEERIEIRRRILETGSGLSSIKVSLKEGEQRVKDWVIDRRGWTVLGAGLRRVYESGWNALAAVHEERSVETLHEWRKQVKYLWHHLKFLQPLRPAIMDQFIAEAHTLGDLLGDDHDLAVLRQKLSEETDRFPNRESVAALLEFIDRRRRELQDEALEHGGQLYDENPGTFVERIEKYWHAWHSTITV